MSEPARGTGPNVQSLFALFPPAHDMPSYEIVLADAVPSPYRELLVHEDHMTVTVEAYHGDSVDVKVLAWRQSGDEYARKILLALHGNGRIVQFGIVRVNLGFCSPAVRDAIRARREPLGRILIQHNVLRRIEPTAFLRVVPSPDMLKWFGLDQLKPTYGRLGMIHCDEQPAVEVLEIVRPE